MKKLLTLLKSLIKRGYVSRIYTDSNHYPIIQVSYLGKVGDAELITPYGYNCNPPIKTPLLILNMQGFENNRAAIPFLENDRFKNLAPGEIKFGNPQTGSYIYFKEDGKIEIESKDDLDITISGNCNITVSGNVNVNATDVDVNATDVTITASSSVAIDSPATSLGVGGNAIARSGDQIKVNIGGTDYFGTITGGGTNTSI